MFFEVNNKLILINDDCLNAMSDISDKSIDLILCDLPYGITNAEWDTIIPFGLLWEQYNRIIKDNGAIILFSMQPFTTKVIQSNLKDFRYCWYWVKNYCTGFSYARYQPMRKLEDICVFYKKHPTYNPQGLIKIENPKIKKGKESNLYRSTLNNTYTPKYKNYPNNLLYFNGVTNKERLHPTQKPIELLEYIIKTYTNENDIVLDNCMGSGSTGEACHNLKRHFIGIEKDKEFFNIALKRLNYK